MKLFFATAKFIFSVPSRFQLYYFGTSEKGLSKVGGTDLVPFEKEYIAKFKTKETKRKALQKAFTEALEKVLAVI